MIFVFLFIILIFSITHLLNAQKDTAQKSENILNYLQDDVLESTHSLKFNFASIIAGDFSISYEKILSRSFTVEGGLGILLPYYTPSLSELTGYQYQIIQNPEGRFSFVLQPKIYLGEGAPDGNFIALKLRIRNYKQDSLIINFTDILFRLGTQYIFGRRYLFEVSTGTGIRTVSPENLVIPVNAIPILDRLIFDLDIKLGIIL